jgi:hypothetical protein
MGHTVYVVPAAILSEAGIDGDPVAAMIPGPLPDAAGVILATCATPNA